MWAPAGVAAELAAAGSLESPGRFQSARRRLLRSCEALGKEGGRRRSLPARLAPGEVWGGATVGRSPPGRSSVSQWGLGVRAAAKNTGIFIF